MWNWIKGLLPRISFSFDDVHYPFVDELEAELEIKDETIKKLKERVAELEKGNKEKTLLLNEKDAEIQKLKEGINSLYAISSVH